MLKSCRRISEFAFKRIQSGRYAANSENKASLAEIYNATSYVEHTYSHVLNEFKYS